ncbi:intraflagellar transport protein 27 homolog isoform X2 [Denticeps clupeoides]|uniref:Small monomeric GTPase n=1 Tax=Denticeps clupeoides TaxID=299321 RepID=A0AAY4AAI1_9TELE|nr:intraflagellar transport protein 27 homolog isoform X2 [Denticeps clupeoides]
MVKLRARCILVGDAAVGKSTLLQVFSSDGSHFQKSYSMTTGLELVTKSVNIPMSIHSVELYIFDVAGRDTFVEACEKLCGWPCVGCLVFDISNKNSFSNCQQWLERVKTHCPGQQVPGVLVGNKSDLTSRREVEAVIAQEWAQNQGLEYHETSAKEMQVCEAPFVSLAQTYYTLYQDQLQTIQNLI